MAYANDTIIIVRSLASVKEAFQLLEKASKEEGFILNEGKIKYIVAANPELQQTPRNGNSKIQL